MPCAFKFGVGKLHEDPVDVEVQIFVISDEYLEDYWIRYSVTHHCHMYYPLFYSFFKMNFSRHSNLEGGNTRLYLLLQIEDLKLSDQIVTQVGDPHYDGLIPIRLVHTRVRGESALDSGHHPRTPVNCWLLLPEKTRGKEKTYIRVSVSDERLKDKDEGSTRLRYTG